MTPERLAEIRARYEAATPGPWRLWGMQVRAPRPERPDAYDVSDTHLVADTCDESRGLRTWNAEFIAHARTDIPDLLAEVEWLNAELAEALRYKRAFEWLEARRPEVRPDIVDEDEDGLPTPDMLGLPVDSDFWRIKHHGDDTMRRLDVMGVRLLETVEAAMQEAPRG